MYCSECGKTINPGVKFCGECGTLATEAGSGDGKPASSVVPDRSVVANRGGAEESRKPLSAWQGVLIGVGILFLLVVLAAFMGESVQPLIGLLVLGTTVWACVDSYQIRQRYKAKDATEHPLGMFFALIFLWLICFPMYLVQRSRVLAKHANQSLPLTFVDPDYSAPSTTSSGASKWIGPVFALLIICDGALNQNVSEAFNKKIHAGGSWADVLTSLIDFRSHNYSQAPLSDVANATAESEAAKQRGREVNTTRIVGSAVAEKPTILAAQTGDTGNPSQKGKFSHEHDVCVEKSGGSFSALMECMGDETVRQDILLNSAYKQVMAALTQQKLESRKELLQLERLWIKNREAKCRYEANADDGEAARLGASSCFVSMTAERARELEAERDSLK
jgi:uncharacterized protein YecT (DUF1311 family)